MRKLILLAKAALVAAVNAPPACAPAVVRDYGAFKRKLLYGLDGRVLETRKEPTLAELQATIEQISGAVETMRKKNDERLAEIEKKGAADPLTTEALKKMQEEVAELRQQKKDIEELRLKLGRPQLGGEVKQLTPEQKEHRTAFLGYMRNPNSNEARDRFHKAEKAAIKADDAAAAEFETRAVATTTDGAGGYAVPEIISRQIHKELLELSELRNIVSVVSVGSKDYKELVDKNGATYGWVGETDARPETNTPTLDQVAPTFGMLYAYPKATEESLTDMFFDVEAWLQTAVAEGFSAGEENAIVNGNGTNKPTGFLTGTPVATDDASRAFGVLQYVATGVAADWKAFAAGTASQLDTFKQVIYQLKKGYRSNSRWLMNKSTAGEVMLFKDADSNYVWQQSVLEGQPDRLLGYPVSESEEMPDKAAGTFPVAFGDFKAGYVLADLVGLRITRDEITTPGYVKWYVRKRLGGKIRMSQAIKLIKIAAS